MKFRLSALALARGCIPPAGLSQARCRLTPCGLTSCGLTPRGLTPRGLTPRGLTPRGLTPRGLAPRSLTPRGLILCVLTLCGLLFAAGCSASDSSRTVSTVPLGENRLHYDSAETTQAAQQKENPDANQAAKNRHAQITPLAASQLLGGGFEATRQALFSPPDWVRYEGDVSLWQYRGQDCVLDAIFWRDESAELFAAGDLTPKAKQEIAQGTGQATEKEREEEKEQATSNYGTAASPVRLRYIETRGATGEPTDPNACLTSLRQERAALRLTQ